MKKKQRKLAVPKDTDDQETNTPEFDRGEVLESLRYAAAESPNRVVMPRKIGKRRPEEERGYKPTVL